MSIVVDYSIVRRATQRVARRFGLQAADVLLLVAIAERDGTARTDELQLDLGLSNGTAIRRSLLALRPRWCVGGDKPGARLPITLTAEGWTVARDVLDEQLGGTVAA